MHYKHHKACLLQTGWQRITLWKKEETDSPVICKKGFLCRSKSSPMRAYILVPGDGSSDKLFISTNEHIHEQEKVTTTRGLSVPQKRVVNELYDDSVKKPKQVMDGLWWWGLLPLPSMMQLKNYLTQVCKVKDGPPSMSLCELGVLGVKHVTLYQEAAIVHLLCTRCVLMKKAATATLNYRGGREQQDTFEIAA